ncbi:MAG: metalloenzyme [Myxococcaceae bacterium]
MRVALLFTDGVGVGPRDAATNPLTDGEFLLSQFDDGSGTALPASGRRIDVDTTFGIDGRPQSASNQTAIFTGLPAPRLINGHVLGFPNAPLRQTLREHSIVKRMVTAGRSVSFANAYATDYLDALGLPRREGTSEGLVFPEKLKKRIKASASTLAMAAGPVPLRTFDDLRRGEGLTHDVDGQMARRRFDVPTREPEAAAEIFWKVQADFTLFEHYLADEAGHSRDRGAALDALRTFDRFARAVIATRPADTQVLVISDHGNVEDLSTRNHTRNPVAFLSFGPAVLPEVRDVAGVGAAALALLGVGP